MYDNLSSYSSAYADYKQMCLDKRVECDQDMPYYRSLPIDPTGECFERYILIGGLVLLLVAFLMTKLSILAGTKLTICLASLAFVIYLIGVKIDEPLHYYRLRNGNTKLVRLRFYTKRAAEELKANLDKLESIVWPYREKQHREEQEARQKAKEELRRAKLCTHTGFLTLLGYVERRYETYTANPDCENDRFTVTLPLLDGTFDTLKFDYGVSGLTQLVEHLAQLDSQAYYERRKEVLWKMLNVKPLAEGSDDVDVPRLETREV